MPDLPAKSTRRMTPDEVQAEATRFGVPHHPDVEELRSALKAHLERLWLDHNQDFVEANNAWVEKYGLPLEKYRLF